MNANDIATTLRKLTPLVDDYMDLYEYERQALAQVVDLIKQQQADLTRKTAQLQEAMELLGLASMEMRHSYQCDVCIYRDSQPTCSAECEDCELDCQCKPCNDGRNFRWQHADRYEALKARIEKVKEELF